LAPATAGGACGLANTAGVVEGYCTAHPDDGCCHTREGGAWSCNNDRPHEWYAKSCLAQPQRAGQPAEQISACRLARGGKIVDGYCEVHRDERCCMAMNSSPDCDPKAVDRWLETCP
jgi:hypothetical protein